MQTSPAIVHWEGDGNERTLDLGFVPEFVELFLDIAATNPDKVTWFKDFIAHDSMYGIKTQGSDGVVTRITTAATGISVYDDKVEKVLLPAPNGEGKVAQSISQWVVGGTQPTARSTTVCGSTYRPTHTKRTGLVYECTTGSGVLAAEPTWPTKAGDSVTDANSNTFIAREEDTVVESAKGVKVGATIQTDAKEYYLIAHAPGRSKDFGNADNF